MRILLIEDDRRLAGFVGEGLSAAGFAVDAVARLDEAEAALSSVRFDAVVLDLGLPDGDGLGLLSRARGTGNATPVLILTARDAVADRVAGLDRGADDYVLKPFDMAELVARLKALLRRPGGVLGLTLSCGGLSFDTVGREVTVGDTAVALSRRELAVLELLMRRAGRVVPKAVIEDGIYGFDDVVTSNSVEVHVHRLRRKLEAVDAGIFIHTLRGVGYLLTEARP